MAQFDFKSLLNRMKRGAAVQEVVAFDFSQSLPRCAKLRRLNGEIEFVAGVSLSARDFEADDSPIQVPKPLMCRHASICVSGKNALVKLLSLPGHLDANSEAKIREDMGVGEGEYRIGYQVLSSGHGRAETKLLTIAVPEGDFMKYLRAFATGWPVPAAIELAGLAAINAFIAGYLASCEDESIGVIHAEDEVSFFAFIHKKELVLFRKFDFGQDHVLNAIQTRLNVNRETAMNVASDQSFDISQMIKEVGDSFIRQIVISKHFVERRENCRVSRIFVPATAAASHRIANEIKVASEAEVEMWDPFRAVKSQPGATPAGMAAQSSSFAAVIGAAVGLFSGGVNQ